MKSVIRHLRVLNYAKVNFKEKAAKISLYLIGMMANIDGQNIVALLHAVTCLGESNGQCCEPEKGVFDGQGQI